MDYITPAEFEDRMNELVKIHINIGDDPEMFHVEADALMCEILKAHGYEAGVEIFASTKKWYA